LRSQDEPTTIGRRRTIARSTEDGAVLSADRIIGPKIRLSYPGRQMAKGYRQEVVPGRLWRSSRIDGLDKRELETFAKTIRSIVNLQRSRRADEKAAKRYELNLLAPSIPNGHAPTDKQMVEILNFCEDRSNWPIDVHCNRGTRRTGTIVAIVRALCFGVPFRSAIRHAIEVDHVRREQAKFIRAFLHKVQEGHIVKVRIGGRVHWEIVAKKEHTAPRASGGRSALSHYIELPRGPNDDELERKLGRSLGRISRSKQPTEEGVHELANSGVDVVNSLRHGRNRKTVIEARTLKKLGIEFHEFGLSTSKTDREVIEECLSTIRKARGAGKNVHWHCQAGKERTGLITALVQLEQGIDPVKIHEDMVANGFLIAYHPHLRPLMLYFEAEVQKKYPGLDTAFLWESKDRRGHNPGLRTDPDARANRRHSGKVH
jgi:protein tyrosine/serine phosphatase